MSARPYRDRRDAGRALAGLLERYRGRDDVVVLALPRGGVPVAHEVAAALSAPLDVFVVRKLGVPDHEELAMGAIAAGGAVVVNEDVMRGLRLGRDELRRVAEQEARELRRRERAYREGRPPPDPRRRRPPRPGLRRPGAGQLLPGRRYPAATPFALWSIACPSSMVSSRMVRTPCTAPALATATLTAPAVPSSGRSAIASQSSGPNAQ